MRPRHLVHIRISLWATTLTMVIVGAVLMVAAVSGLRWALARSEDRSASTAHRLEVIAQAHALARSAAATQTIAGMLPSTGVPADLRPQYLRSIDRCRAELEALDALVTGDEQATTPLARVHARYADWERSATSFTDAAGDAGTAAPGGAIASRRRPAEGSPARAAFLAREESLLLALDELAAAELRAARTDGRADTTLNRRIDRAAVAAMFGMMLAAVAGLLVFTQRVRRPLAELTASALALARGDLRRRVAVRGNDEICSLADSFNVMAEQLDRQLRQDEALRHARELLHAAHDPAEVERLLALLAPECVPGTSGHLYLLDESGEQLVPRSGWASAGPAKPFSAETCWAFRLGRVHEVSVTHNVRCAHASDLARDTACIPLGARGSILGILEVAFVGATPRGITELGDTIALTLANLRAREVMQREAQRDGLTGIFNRRHFERALALELARARDEAGALSVVLLDIDHFKRFNDTHGHAAGDAVLRQVAGALAAQVRDSDLVCRYGGEEFVVVLPRCDAAAAAAKAEAIRAAVSGMRVQCAGRLLDAVTVSAGVASFPADGASRDAVVGAADEALYRSKSSGRDRVTCAARIAPRSSAA